MKLSNQYLTTLDLMLIANDPGFSFVNARWPAAKSAYPFLGGDVSEAAGEARYDGLMEAEKPLACLLNLGEAMSQIALAQGTPLDYIKQVRWDAPYALTEPSEVYVLRWIAGQTAGIPEFAPMYTIT